MFFPLLCHETLMNYLMLSIFVRLVNDNACLCIITQQHQQERRISRSKHLTNKKNSVYNTLSTFVYFPIYHVWHEYYEQLRIT